MDRAALAHPEHHCVSAAPSGGVPLGHGLVLAGIGGAMGALMRWSLGTVLPVGNGFPWTTLAINVGGSALLAALPLLSLVHRRPWLPVLLGPGLLGGFTTMSTFSLEAFALADSGRPALAGCYVAATLLGAVAAVALVERSAPGGRAGVDRSEGAA